MKPFEVLGQTIAADGAEMKLLRRGDDYSIVWDGAVLMSSRMYGSEKALATLACERARTLERPGVLIGGLGMGFTLRATLDLLPTDATVVVAELVPSVVEWNRGPLGPLAEHPLDDKRVSVEIGDVADMLRSRPGQFDAVLLDVDNGPDALTSPMNGRLYTTRGIAVARAALKAQGVLAVWAVNGDQKFEQRLRDGGFEVKVRRARGHLNRGARHTIFLGYKC